MTGISWYISSTGGIRLECGLFLPRELGLVMENVSGIFFNDDFLLAPAEAVKDLSWLFTMRPL